MDIEGSARRDDLAFRRMRDDLYEILDRVTLGDGISATALSCQDCGDGMRVIVPLDVVPPASIVDAFVAGLTAGLREHRRYVDAHARIRLRVSFDIGLIESHRHNWTGEPLIRAARLVDALPVRDALATARDLDLVVVVSDEMFRTVVRHGFGMYGPTRFREIQVQIKEFNSPAWLLESDIAARCSSCPCR
ncbi:hypothetical protein Val02_77650 [Virgisporangium aliadipatigenens]|uniref:Uncharacterized protein n=1 Tax=Virgisporangium aliadipatigenens TaxID=741659 RepID=A0A8J3YSH2_9ACTN|nr:hypothetical protein Val02_77650 [Virgisporangium aliadipatigenens]